MKHEVKLGVPCDYPEGEHRDAVHIAVVPVKAYRTLNPGEHVGVDYFGMVNDKLPHMGVIDPFLKGPVRPMQSVWLFIYPGTFQNLRHQWDHPGLRDTSVRMVEVDSGSCC
jgi:hypothetical protein